MCFSYILKCSNLKGIGEPCWASRNAVRKGRANIIWAVLCSRFAIVIREVASQFYFHRFYVTRPFSPYDQICQGDSSSRFTFKIHESPDILAIEVTSIKPITRSIRHLKPSRITGDSPREYSHRWKSHCQSLSQLSLPRKKSQEPYVVKFSFIWIFWILILFVTF